MLPAVELGDLLPLEEGVGGERHPDVLINLRRLLEVRLDGLDHTGRLIDLLALLHALLEVLLLLLYF